MRQRTPYASVAVLVAVAALLALQAWISSLAVDTLQASNQATGHADRVPPAVAFGGIDDGPRDTPSSVGESLFNYQQRFFTAATFATQATDGFCTFARSAVQNHVPLQVLGWGRGKMGHHEAVTVKVKTIETYLRR